MALAMGLFMSGTATAEDTAAEPESTADSGVIEEVIVTANRREQNVQDVSGSINVLGGGALEAAGVAKMADYIFTLPGVDLVDSGIEKKIGIRGVANVGTNPAGSGNSPPPVGLYLNDTPIQGNGVLPDLTLYDMERIEVLRGPQGTLYGEGAQGGALKMLLRRADPSEFSAKAEVTVGSTRFADGLNHTQAGVVNVPLGDSWAVRIVGSRRETAGFVDYFNRGSRGDGEDDTTNSMGRLHLDGSLGDGLELSVMVLHQEQRLEQIPEVQKAEGRLRNRNTEPTFKDTDFTLASFTLDYELPFAQLTSSTSGFRNESRVLSRLPLLEKLIGFPFDEEWVEAAGDQSAFTQEFRLVSTGDSRIDWVAGVFYRTRKNEFDWILTVAGAGNAVLGLPTPFPFAGATGEEKFEQVAGFGEVTFDLPGEFEFTTGVRVFSEKAELMGHPLRIAEITNFDIKTTEVAPMASLSWFIDDDRMLYARVANGVRSGGTNHNALQSTATPLFKPDSLWTYEVGAKTQWLDGRLTANLALFENEWDDLQVNTTELALNLTTGMEGPSGVILNVANAFTRGAEFQLEARPVEGLSLGFQIAWLDGEITEGDPSGDGDIADGSDMPQLSKLSYSASMRYDAWQWPVFGMTPFLSVDTQRVGSRDTKPPSLLLFIPKAEGFHLYGAMVGLTGGKMDLSLGVRNLTDERNVLAGNFIDPDTLMIGAPRTWTARVALRF